MSVSSDERILSREVEYACQWLEVVSKRVLLDPPRGEETFYSVRTTTEYGAFSASTPWASMPSL